MKETSDQAEGLLLEWEKRVGVNQESSEKLETQLKVFLIQQSRDHGPSDQVVRAAKTLAACLGTRGDWEQAAQYVTMAANLERMALPPGRDWPKAGQPEADSSLGQVGAKGPGTDPDSFGQSLRRLWRPRRGPRFGAWGWILKRERP